MEVTVKEWFVKVGDKVAQFDNICEVQSDKASVTITSRYDGVVKKLHYEVDAIAKVGLPLVDIEVDGEPEVADAASTGGSTSSDSESENKTSHFDTHHNKALATPAVRRIASEHKVDITMVSGSGKGGRVMKEDILAFISGKEGGQQRRASPSISAPSSASATQTQHSPRTLYVAPALMAADKIVPITGYAKTMVKTMTSANAVPHFVYSDEINVGPLMEMRLQLKKAAEKRSIKLSYMPFFLKAISLSLLQFPMLNATVNADCTEVTHKSSHNIGFATDTPNGLVVPNIKEVQSLKIFDIAGAMNHLIQAAMNGSLAPRDVTGGTFSLSNIGSIGGTYTKPVLLVPEVVIGALGRFQKLPRFDDNGSVAAAHIMCVSWAADHRVVDGATVARFSNMFKELLENPIELVIQ